MEHKLTTLEHEVLTSGTVGKSLHLYFVNKFICNFFLDTTYKGYFMIYIFLYLFCFFFNLNDIFVNKRKI